MRPLLILLALCGAGCGSPEAAEAPSGGEVSVLLPPPTPLAPVEPPPAPIAAEPEAAPAPEARAPDQLPAPETALPEPEPAAEPTAAEEAPLAAGPVDRPPLPPATIAGTIRRIGYACPNVASTAPMAGGEPGTRRYRITCSSGDVYRATVAGGRMRFRKIDADD